MMTPKQTKEMQHQIRLLIDWYRSDPQNFTDNSIDISILQPLADPKNLLFVLDTDDVHSRTAVHIGLDEFRID